MGPVGGGARLRRGIAASRGIPVLLPAAGPSAGSSGSAHPTLGMDEGEGGKRRSAAPTAATMLNSPGNGSRGGEGCSTRRPHTHPGTAPWDEG